MQLKVMSNIQNILKNKNTESILKGKGGITFDAKARGPATNISYMDIVKSRQKQ